MAIPASFNSATGALTGDNLDNTIATGRDAAQPSLRGDPDDGGQIQRPCTGRRPASGVTPTTAARSKAPCTGRPPASGATPTPAARSRAPCTGRPPASGSDPDSGGQIQSAAHRPTPSLRDDPDAGGQIQSAMQRPTPSLWDDPDAGGQIQSVVQQFAGGQHAFTASDMAGASDQLMLGATSRLVQATASFSAAGAADTSTTLPLGAETSQPSFLTTPQHP